MAREASARIPQMAAVESRLHAEARRPAELKQKDFPVAK